MILKYNLIFLSLMITGHIRAIQQEKDDLIDIYQDSVIAMYQNFTTKQTRIENSSLKTYLFSIGKHKIYDRLKERKQFVGVVVTEASDVVGGDVVNDGQHVLRVFTLKHRIWMIGSSGAPFRYYRFRL